jgi:hypothetical protein
MKQFLLLSYLAAGLSLPTLAQPTRTKALGVASTSTPLAAVFSNYWEEQAKLFPLQATSQGDNRFNNLLPKPAQPL